MHCQWICVIDCSIYLLIYYLSWYFVIHPSIFPSRLSHAGWCFIMTFKMIYYVGVYLKPVLIKSVTNSHSLKYLYAFFSFQLTADTYNIIIRHIIFVLPNLSFISFLVDIKQMWHSFPNSPPHNSGIYQKKIPLVWDFHFLREMSCHRETRMTRKIHQPSLWFAFISCHYLSWVTVNLLKLDDLKLTLYSGLAQIP